LTAFPLRELRRLEIERPKIAWNYLVSRVELFERCRYDPVKIRKTLNAVIETALERVSQSRAAVRKERFLVWTVHRVWSNNQYVSAHFVNTKLTTGLSQLRAADIFNGAFRQLPEYIHCEGGGDPVMDGASPMYWYRAGTVLNIQPIEMATKVQLLTALAEVFEDRRKKTLISDPNPYQRSIDELKELQVWESGH
jgi:hypothetical protein